MGQTQLPCIVQALPATTSMSEPAPRKPDNVRILSMPTGEIPCIVQALPATNATDKGTSIKRETPSRKGNNALTPSKQDSSLIQMPPSSRCTRSQAAPDWTQQELLILVSEIAALDEDWLKTLSSYQRWKILSDNCAASNVTRSSSQCKRRWELLLDDYKKIRDWESQKKGASYWSLDGEQRKSFDLPASFDYQVFDSMDAVIKAQEHEISQRHNISKDLISAAKMEQMDVNVKPAGCRDNDSAALIDAALVEKMDVDAYSGPEEETCSSKSQDKAQEMVCKLQDTSQLILAILKGELKGNAANGNQVAAELEAPNGRASKMEFAIQQATELITAFGELNGTVNQLIHLIKELGLEGIIPGNSISS